jgi:hypothetical protein
LRVVAGLTLEKSGTVSMMTDEFSRPYQRSGDPQNERMAYLAFMVR